MHSMPFRTTILLGIGPPLVVSCLKIKELKKKLTGFGQPPVLPLQGLGGSYIVQHTHWVRVVSAGR